MQHKRVFLSVIILMRICIGGFPQSISVDTMVDFYKNIDIDCYKENIAEGMAQFNTWLRDSLPTKTEMPSWYTPSDINLQEREVIPLVALNFYKMKNFDSHESIYNHIIIDSTLSVVLIVLDEKRKPVGITDVAGKPYSYIDFTIDKDVNSYQQWEKQTKEFLQICKNYNPEALIYLNHRVIRGSGYIKKDILYLHVQGEPKPLYKATGVLGFIKKGRIYIIPQKQKMPEELEKYIKKYLKHDKDYITNSDWMLNPKTEKEFRDKDANVIPFEIRHTGNTPPEKMRICF